MPITMTGTTIKTKQLKHGMRVQLGHGQDRFEGIIVQDGRKYNATFLTADCKHLATRYANAPGEVSSVDLHNNPHRGRPSGSLGCTNGNYGEPIVVLEILGQETLIPYPQVFAGSGMNNNYHGEMRAHDKVVGALLTPGEAKRKKIEFSVKQKPEEMRQASVILQAMKLDIRKAICPTEDDAPRQKSLQLTIVADFSAFAAAWGGPEQLSITCNGSHGDPSLGTYVSHHLGIDLELDTAPSLPTVKVSVCLMDNQRIFSEGQAGILARAEATCELARFDFDAFFEYTRQMCAMTSYFATLDPVNFAL